MRSLKSAFGIIGTLFAIAYCGGLAFYFLDLTGSMSAAQDQGLGPTIFGLGGVGAIFVLVLVFQIVRPILKTRSPRGDRDPEAPRRRRESGFDADAAFNRYMAQRPPDATPPPASTVNGQTSKTTGFGRKK